MDALAERFLSHIQSVLQEDYKSARHDASEYAIVGHSLGNIITRHCSARLPPGLCRFAMLAPPNHSPLLAKRLEEHPLFRILTKDAGQRLADDSFYKNLDSPDVPTLIFAGNKGPKRPWLPFKERPSDGVVLVDETRLAGAKLIVLPVLHTFIMNHPVVAKELNRFLKCS